MDKLLQHGRTVSAWTAYCSIAILFSHAHNIIPAWPNYCCIAKLFQHGHTIAAPPKKNDQDIAVDDSSISRVVEILQPFAKPTVLLDYSLEVR
jgi:hypothetical protein